MHTAKKRPQRSAPSRLTPREVGVLGAFATALTLACSSDPPKFNGTEVEEVPPGSGMESDSEDAGSAPASSEHTESSDETPETDEAQTDDEEVSEGSPPLDTPADEVEKSEQEQGAPGVNESSNSRGDAPAMAEPSLELPDCEEEEYLDIIEDLPVCLPLSPCLPGEYVETPATRFSDRECSSCPEATYSSQDNVDACLPWTACEEGMTASTAPSDVTDVVCSTCGMGAYELDGECVALTECDASEFEAAAPTGTSDRLCEELTSCTADEYESKAPTPVSDRECSLVGSCAPGQWQSSAPTSNEDRQCTPCTPGTFSTTENADSCTEWTTCGSGETESAAPSATTDRVCSTCGAGMFENDGNCTQLTQCQDDEYQSTAPTAISDRICSEVTDCPAGTVVVQPPNETADRQCQACPAEQFNTTRNATECRPWSSCGWSPVATQGTAESDVVCQPGDVVEQFGSSDYEHVEDIALDASGALYAGGSGQGGTLRKYNPDGSLSWARSLSTGGVTHLFSIAVTPGGDAFVVGDTDMALDGEELDHYDAYVRKYSPSGNVEWTRQFGSDSDDQALGVAVDGSGNAVVVGLTLGTLFGPSGVGGAFIRVYDTNGNATWSSQFGQSGESEHLEAAATDSAGNIYVVGRTTGQLGEVSFEGADTFVRKYSLGGDIEWTTQFGTDDSDYASDIAVSSTGQVYVVGTTYGDLAGDHGGADAFLAALDENGTVAWIEQMGTSNGDEGQGVAIAPSGHVLMAGNINQVFGSPFDPTTWSGNIFLSTTEPNGAPGPEAVLGTNVLDEATSVAVSADGRVFIGGETSGDWEGTNAGATDGVIIQIAP